MSSRSCEATLRWKDQLVTVASRAAQLDLDAFDIDLGLGAPVAAFQIRATADQCCMEYKLYSLERPPRLLRAITGGDLFSAADTDLDGRVEIWTTDAAALSGFDQLALADLDSAPTIVLRYEHGDLLDATSEFQPYAGSQIAALRKQLSPNDLREFKNSDGKLSLPASSPQHYHRLRQTKIKVLEIVWGYLYSGRESQAWSTLAELWPNADVGRIRAAIIEARARGIVSQTAGASTPSAGKRPRRVRIFNAILQPSAPKPEVSPPEPILLWRPPPPGTTNHAPSTSEFFVDLTIDSAGKVRSAEPSGRVDSLDAPLLQAAAGWKFIPALYGGRPVACRTRMAVSLRQ